MVEGEPIPVRELNPRVSAELAAVAQKALAKNPEDRYADGAALGRDLARALRGEPVEALEGEAEWRRLWREQRRLVAWLVLAAVCLGVALGLANTQYRGSWGLQLGAVNMAGAQFLEWEDDVVYTRRDDSAFR